MHRFLMAHGDTTEEKTLAAENTLYGGVSREPWKQKYNDLSKAIMISSGIQAEGNHDAEESMPRQV